MSAPRHPRPPRSALGSALAVAAICAALLLAGGSARADDAPAPAADAAAAAPPLPVSIETRFGFGRQLVSRGFVPVTVTLSASEALPGVRVRVSPEERPEAELFSLGPVALEAGVPRQVSGTVAVHLVRDVGPLTVTCETASGEVVGEAQAAPDATHARLLLVLDRRGGFSTDLGLEPTERSAQWEVLTLGAVDALPQSPLAYAGVAAVLLGDLEVERWSVAQAAALAGWVARGGHLLISLGSRAPVVKRSQLGRALQSALAPIPFDAAPVGGAEVRLSRLLATHGDIRGLETTSPPYLTRLHPGPADRVSYWADGPAAANGAASLGRPVVVHRHHGLGRVTLIACDLWAPPFLHAPHTPRLVHDLLAQWGSARPSRSALLFSELKQVRQPAQVGGVFALLVCYALVAGPGAYFVLRAKRRGILVWVVIPALTLAFSAMVPLYRLSLRDAESILVGVRLVDTRSGAQVALETTDVLLFSGSLEPKSMLLPGPDAAAHTVIPPQRALSRRGDRQPRPDRVLGAPDGKQLRFELPVALWGSRYVSTTRTWKGRALEGTVHLGGDPSGASRVRLTLEYGGGVKLLDPVLVYPGRSTPMAVPLGRSLSPGASVDQVLELGTPCGSFEVEENTLGPLVLQRLASGLYGELAGDRRAFLLATTDEAPPLKARPNVRTRAFGTVVVIELPVVFEDTVPPGAWRRSHTGRTVAWIDSQTVTREQVTRLELPHPSTKRAGAIELQLQPPRGRGVREVGVAARYAGADGAGWRALPVEAIRAERVAGGGVRYRLDLPDPARALSAGGVIELRQRFTRPILEPDAAHALRLGVRLAWEGSASLRPEPEPLLDPALDAPEAGPGG